MSLYHAALSQLPSKGGFMFDLRDKIALVTGASGGIGAQIATALHLQGAMVALHGTRADKLEALKAELGERAVVVTANLADRNAAASLVDAASEAAGGPVNILVNNAGITRDGLLMRMKNEDWDDVLEVNMTAGMILCRAAMRAMMKVRSGRIISISSVVGVMGNPGQTNYAASKAGMIGFSKSLAAEVASRGITVNVVAPGFIQTPMTDILDDGQKEALLTRVPAGRLGTADEIAASVVFLASDEAAYITGTTMHVNGGMAML
jgi:3-oxoacyl-[acyl-carrier protein] reductase